MVEKNQKKQKAKRQRVMNGFNTGTRDMRLKTAYRRKKRWSAEDADHLPFEDNPFVLRLGNCSLRRSAWF